MNALIRLVLLAMSITALATHRASAAPRNSSSTKTHSTSASSSHVPGRINSTVYASLTAHSTTALHTFTTSPLPSASITSHIANSNHTTTTKEASTSWKDAHSIALTTSSFPSASIPSHTANSSGTTTTSTASSLWKNPPSTETIVLCVVIPFAACMLLYSIFKCVVAKRRARARTRGVHTYDVLRPFSRKTSNSSTTKGKITDDGPSLLPYFNNPRLKPHPSHPQMVYVPPVQDGSRAIFGHLRTPSGHVYGVADRWLIHDGGGGGGGRGGIPGRSNGKDSKSVFVHPL